MDCYRFHKITFPYGLLDDAVDATYVIHLEGNGRYETMMQQLKKYKPSRVVYILFNKGYKTCKKDPSIQLPAQDLVDAYLHIFRHAQSYRNILVLEDDFFFSSQTDDRAHRSIASFVQTKTKRGEDFQYMLGCIPFLSVPVSFDHWLGLVSIGTHAVIYSPANRRRVLKTDQRNIGDWDAYNCFHTRRYMYKEPICYQLFPPTENSKHWNQNNAFLGTLGNITIKMFAWLHLDKQVEPGYPFWYAFSKLLFFLLFLWILYFLFKKR
jgi:hypothetical protein